MELFIALFGGIFYLLKFFSDKSASKRHDKEFEREMASKARDYDIWLNAVVDDDLEKRCKDAAWRLVYHGNDGTKEILLQGVDDDLRGVFDALPVELKRLAGDNKDLALIALMATFGKLPYSIAADGMICRPYSGVRENRRQDEEEWWNKRDFFILIDKVLAEHMPFGAYGRLCCDYYPKEGDPYYSKGFSGLGIKMQERDPREVRSPTCILYYWYPGRRFKHSRI